MRHFRLMRTNPFLYLSAFTMIAAPHCFDIVCGSNRPSATYFPYRWKNSTSRALVFPFFGIQNPFPRGIACAEWTGPSLPQTPPESVHQWRCFPEKKAFPFAVGPPEHAWYGWLTARRCGDGSKIKAAPHRMNQCSNVLA
jgi:hypothetical protein